MVIDVVGVAIFVVEFVGDNGGIEDGAIDEDDEDCESAQSVKWI